MKYSKTQLKILKDINKLQRICCIHPIEDYCFCNKKALDVRGLIFTNSLKYILANYKRSYIHSDGSLHIEK